MGAAKPGNWGSTVVKAGWGCKLWLEREGGQMGQRQEGALIEMLEMEAKEGSRSQQ
jgi:hypothetical protein